MDHRRDIGRALGWASDWGSIWAFCGVWVVFVVGKPLSAVHECRRSAQALGANAHKLSVCRNLGD